MILSLTGLLVIFLSLISHSIEWKAFRSAGFSDKSLNIYFSSISILDKEDMLFKYILFISACVSILSLILSFGYLIYFREKKEKHHPI